MSENIKKVAVVILNYNGLEDTLECLKSLSKIKENIVFLITNGGIYAHVICSSTCVENFTRLSKL